MTASESRRGVIAPFLTVLAATIVTGVVVKHDATVAGWLGNSNLALATVFFVEAVLAAAFVLSLSWLGRAVGSGRVEHRVRKIEGLMPKDAKSLEELVKGVVGIQILDVRDEFKKLCGERDPKAEGGPDLAVTVGLLGAVGAVNDVLLKAGERIGGDAGTDVVAECTGARTRLQAIARDMLDAAAGGDPDLNERLTKMAGGDFG